VGDLVPFPPHIYEQAWLSKKQLASYLGRSTRWIERLGREGLPSVLQNGRRRYRLSAVLAFLEEYGGAPPRRQVEHNQDREPESGREDSPPDSVA
jgi:hypothetical protein